MKHFLIALLAALIIAPAATAQQTFTVCGVQEFCYCWDGVNNATYTFLSCPDSLENEWPTVALRFCQGSMASGDVIRAYSGEDNNGAPIVELVGGFWDLSVVAGASTTTSLHLEFDWLETPSCQAGDSEPVRFIVWTGLLDFLNPPGTCTGTDPFCLTTGMAAHRPQPSITVRGRELLLPASLAHGTRINLFDACGRVVGGMLPQGRTTVALPNSLGAGVYLAVAESGGVRSSTRFVLSE